MKHRIQFFVDDDLYAEIQEHCKDKDRPPWELALHALKQYMRRYPIKCEKVSLDENKAKD